MSEDPRAFRLPLRSITMSERRLMVTKFGVNWDAVELDLADVPQPADSANPTDAEKMAAARAFTRVVGPVEKFALLYLAVKRELPNATMADIEKNADTGEWALDLSPAEPADRDGGDPLPPPTSETS